MKSGVWAGALVMALSCTSCGGGPSGAAAPSGRCAGVEPSMSESQALPTGTSGGPNAWFEVKVTHAEPVLTDNHLSLDGVEIPIVRITTTGAAEDGSHDPTAGRLITRRGAASASAGGESKGAYANVVSFRIPAGTPIGKKQLAFRTCGLAAPERITIDVLPSPAPVIASIKIVRGEQWPALFIKGSNLIGADKVILVAADGAVSTIDSVTKIDDSEIHVMANGPGTYEVFVQSANGLGGGPPGGVAVVR